MLLFYKSLSMDSDTDERGYNRKLLEYIMDCLLINDRHKSTVAAMLADSIVRIVEMFANCDGEECIAIGDAIMILLKIMLDVLQKKPK